MKAPLRVSVVLAALAGGFGAGVLARRVKDESGRGEETHRVSGRPATNPSTPDSNTRRPDVDVVARTTKPLPIQIPAPSPEALRDQVAILRSQAAGAATGGDGRKLLGIIRQLALLGESGFAAAAEALDLVLTDLAGDWPALGISEDDLALFLLVPELGPLEAWLVSNPACGSSAVRAAAAHYLAFAPDMDPFPVLIAALLKEADPAVARRLAAGMRTASAGDMPALLEAALAQTARGNSAASIALWMGRRGGTAALPYLETLQGSADADVAEEALVQSRLLAPPASGALVTGLPRDSNTSLRRGDIVVSWDGAPVESVRQLSYRLAKMPEGGKATLLVHRGDALVPVTLESKPEGIGARTVGGKR